MLNKPSAGLTRMICGRPWRVCGLRVALLDDESGRVGLERDADDMERIVGQCLSFLRSDAGTTPRPAPLRLADAVSDAVAHQRELGRPVEMTVTPAAAAGGGH